MLLLAPPPPPPRVAILAIAASVPPLGGPQSALGIHYLIRESCQPRCWAEGLFISSLKVWQHALPCLKCICLKCIKRARKTQKAQCAVMHVTSARSPALVPLGAAGAQIFFGCYTMCIFAGCYAAGFPGSARRSSAVTLCCHRRRS